MAVENSGPNILLVDDEESIRQTLGAALRDEGYKIKVAANGSEALNALSKSLADVVLLDIWMPGADGIETLERMRASWPDLPVIMISGHGTVETAVKATKLGAFDFIEKPLSLDKLLITIQHALKLTNLTREYRRLRQQVAAEQELLGRSKQIQVLREQIAQVAPTEGWVLITGENGTGKEVVAKAIHRQSRRAEGPFMDVNCAAIPEELIESELFGYEPGAFTGATAQKLGKFELASGGTLFLDEVADMSQKTQSKVLRVLQEQQFQRVGGTEVIRVNVRVISATNKDLLAAIQRSEFREDLYYRLNVIPLHISPLRERKEDIPLFVDHFLAEFCERSRLKQKKMNKKVLEALMRHAWPGNVRELRNILERMVILSRGPEITMADLPASIGLPGLKSSESALDMPDFKSARAAFEKEFIVRKLIENDNNVSKTAEQIGIERTSLHRKIKSYGIDVSK